MKRILLLCLILAGLASARIFRTTKSGLWSDSTVWASTVPYPNADADTVYIAPTHSCTLDVDLSSITTGFGKLSDSGTLFLKSVSGFKVNNNIIGNGRFRVGDSVTAVESVNVYVNGNFSNQITDAQYWGKERTGILTGFLTNYYAAGATKLHLDRNMGIRADDVVTISDSSTQGLVAGETGLTWGSTNYRVAAYDSVTDTLTLTDAIIAHRHIGDFVAVLTRAIRFHHSGTAATGVANNSKPTQIYRNVWFNGWAVGCVTGAGMTFVSCAGSNNPYGGVAYNCTNGTFSGTFTCSNNTYGGVAYYCPNGTFSGTFTCSNNTVGGVAYFCSNSTFSGTFTCSNNTSGGVARDCANSTFSGTFASSEAYQLNYVSGYVSGTWTVNKAAPQNYRSATSQSRPWNQLVWLNQSGVGRHKIYAYAGVESTLTNLSAVISVLEDTTQGPLIYDIPLVARATTFNFKQKVQKSASMAHLPMIQFFDADADPLKVSPSPAAIVADTMTNSIATDETLSISASGLTVGKRYTLRLSAQNGSGTVTWYGQDIANLGSQMTCAGQGDWFKLFP